MVSGSKVALLSRVVFRQHVTPEPTYAALNGAAVGGPALRSASVYFATVASSSASHRPGNAGKSAGAIAFTAKVSCSHRVPKPVARRLR